MPPTLPDAAPSPLRHRLRLGLLGLALGAALALTGCAQVAIIRSAPLPGGKFDARFGNDPLAAADGAALEAALKQRQQAWTIRIDTQPASAGYVNVSDVNQLIAARGKVQSFHMTLTATVPATLQGFSAAGPQGEQGYLEGLIQNIAAAGYRFTSVQVDIWYLSSHHAVLTWSRGAGFAYKVLDGKP